MSLVYHAKDEKTDVARASIRQYVYFTAGYAWFARKTKADATITTSALFYFSFLICFFTAPSIGAITNATTSPPMRTMKGA